MHNIIGKYSVLFLFSLVSLCSSAQEFNIKDNEKERVEHKNTHLGVVDDKTKIFLRGTFNKWGLDNAFRRVDEGIYVIENVVVFNGRHGMKVGSEDWKTVDVGGNNGSVKLGEEYQLEIGGDNLFVEGISGSQTMFLSRITLDINKLTILMERASDMHPHISLSYADDTEFMTDEMEIGVSFNPDVHMGRIIVEGANGKRDISVKDNVSISIGKGEPVNSTITVICQATAQNGTANNDTIRYVKSERTGVFVYFDAPDSWIVPYCYLWSLRGDQNYPWPGEKMHWDGETLINGKVGWWKIEVSNRYADFGEVIFNNGSTLQSSDDLSMNGVSMSFDETGWREVK